MDFRLGRHVAQRLLNRARGVLARRVVVAAMVDVGRHVEAGDVFGGLVQEAQRGIAPRHHERHVELRSDRIDDAAQRVLFEPDFDVGVGVAPQRFAIEPRRVFERFLDAVERLRLALPARGVGEPIVGQRRPPDA